MSVPRARVTVTLVKRVFVRALRTSRPILPVTIRQPHKAQLEDSASRRRPADNPDKVNIKDRQRATATEACGGTIGGIIVMN